MEGRAHAATLAQAANDEPAGSGPPPAGAQEVGVGGVVEGAVGECFGGQRAADQYQGGTRGADGGQRAAHNPLVETADAMDDRLQEVWRMRVSTPWRSRCAIFAVRAWRSD